MLLLVIECKTFLQKDLVSYSIFTAPPPLTLDAFVSPSALRVTLGASLANSWRIIDNSQVNQGRSISCCDFCCWTCKVLHKEMPCIPFLCPWHLKWLTVVLDRYLLKEVYELSSGIMTVSVRIRAPGAAEELQNHFAPHSVESASHSDLYF